MTELDIEQSVENLELKQDDFILLKGEWEETEIRHLVTLLATKKKANIIVILDEDKGLEILSIDEFYTLMKQTEERLGLNE